MRNLVWIVVFLVTTACGDDAPKVSVVKESLAIDRTELSFGAIFVGGHFVDRIQVQNLGIRDVEVVVEGVPAGFEVEPVTFSLSPQELTVVEVAFRPKELGPSEGTIVFRAKDSNSRGVRLNVDGLGVARALSAPETLDFGDVLVGQTASLPIELVSETDAPLDVNIRHAGGGVFQVDRNRFDVAPGASETIVATFAPSARSPATMTLVLDLCTGCPTMEIVMTGNGLGPKLVASASTLGFGFVAPGLTRSQPLNITNVGDFDVDFGVVETEGTGFGLDLDGFPSRLAVGDTATLPVSFSPPGAGERRGSLFVENAEGTRLLGIPLVGAAGGALIEVTPAAVEFDVAVVGAGTAAIKVQLENVLEPEDLELQSASIEGADADCFSTHLASPVQVRPIAALQVNFAPTRVGDLSAELVLRTTHSEQAEIRVPLSGVAVDPVPCTLRTLYDEVRFGLVDKGEPNRREHRIYNDGTESCPIWGFATSGPDLSAFFFSTTPPDQVVLRPGAMISIPIELKQTAPKGRLLEASLSFMHSALDAPPTVVPISAWLADQSGMKATPSSVTVEPTPIDRATIVSVRLSSPLFPPPVVHLEVSGGSGFRLHPNQRTDIAISQGDVSLVFQPEERELYAAELVVSSPVLPEPLRIRLQGEGMAPCGDAACEWPSATCAAASNTTWWNNVHLNPTLVESTLPITPGFTCVWGVTSGEDQAAVAPIFPGCEADLRVSASGTYSAELLVSDSIGHAAFCDIEAEVVPPVEGLWVEAIPSSTMARSTTLTILHSGGGDPHLKPSWWTTSPLTCSIRTFVQTPSMCSWDDPDADDDPFGYSAFGAAIGSSFMAIQSPSVDHSYHVGFSAIASPGNSADLRGRIFCGGELVADGSVPITDSSEFLFLGSVTFQPDGSCVFDEDGLSWGGHMSCLPGDPHCP